MLYFIFNFFSYSSPPQFVKQIANKNALILNKPLKDNSLHV